MYILAVDTSTRNLSMAVAKDEKVLARSYVKLDKLLSSFMVPKLDALLKKAKVPFSKIDGLVVGLGPGSFTSLRVGLATIKGLAYAENKPIVGIPSLDAIALNAKASDSPICVISDARRNMVYACVYEKQNFLKRKGEYTLSSISDLLKRISGKVTFIGDAVKIYKKEIQNSKLDYKIIEDEKLSLPKAQNFIPVALGRFQKGKVDNIDTLVPLYLYPEDCQVHPSSPR